jgi:hypothetical protein
LLTALARADGLSFSNFVIHVARQHVGLPESASRGAVCADSKRGVKTNKCRQATLDPRQKRRPMVEACAGSGCLGRASQKSSYFEAQFLRLKARRGPK